MCDYSENRPFVPRLPDQPIHRLEASAHRPGLLALSPLDFQFSGDVTPLPREEFTSLLGAIPSKNLEIPSLRCLFTPQGVALHLILLDATTELKDIPEVLREPFHGSSSLSTKCRNLTGSYQSLALLRCQDQYGSLVALALSSYTVLGHTQEPMVVGIHVECTIPEHLHIHSRTIRLGKSTLAFAHAQRLQQPRSREVYIHRHGSLFPASERNNSSSVIWHRTSFNFGKVVTAYIADEVMEDLKTLGFRITPLRYSFEDLTYDKGQTFIIDPRNRDSQTLVAAMTIRSGPFTNGGTQHARQDIKVGVILTNRVVDYRDHSLDTSPRITAARFSVHHFFHTSLLDDDEWSISHSTEASLANDYLAHAVEVPCADDSYGGSGCALRRTKSGTLHAKAEFVLHTDVDWETRDAPDTRLLRVAVRGTPDKHGAGHTFRITVELSERHRPKPHVGALPARAPPRASPPRHDLSAFREADPDRALITVEGLDPLWVSVVSSFVISTTC